MFRLQIVDVSYLSFFYLRLARKTTKLRQNGYVATFILAVATFRPGTWKVRNCKRRPLNNSCILAQVFRKKAKQQLEAVFRNYDKTKTVMKRKCTFYVKKKTNIYVSNFVYPCPTGHYNREGSLANGCHLGELCFLLTVKSD